MLKNKILILVIGFYVFWIGVLPFGLSNLVGVFCKNISHNSQIEIKITKPLVLLSPIPNINFKAENIFVKTKDQSITLNINNFS